MKGFIHSTESFGLVDGPGVRFVIFTAGCPMRCQYCHNPDTWHMKKGEAAEAAELLEKALRYRSYWKDGGGITVSGGEPLMQMDFLLEMFRLAKEENVDMTIDTGGAPFTRDEPFFSKFEELMRYTDRLLVDIKHIDNEKHIALTKVTNENILDMLRYLSDIGKPVWIRHVLVPQRSDSDDELWRLRKFIDTLSNVERVEVLPYHTFGVPKWEKLGLEYELKGIDPPSAERVENAERILGAL